MTPHGWSVEHGCLYVKPLGELEILVSDPDSGSLPHSGGMVLVVVQDPYSGATFLCEEFEYCETWDVSDMLRVCGETARRADVR